ncbi:MAG: LytTR family DNA-binding domain-containing protein [Terracidiphilus sp.]|nr:LytTR family DNA-binding domain-containing protein [Terracidiphilus sp.]MDR3775995.1 LytTR family DNA-binding domain-containing protein [Terracidiphilus sp.]
METAALRAYLVDDEPLAIERLKRLLTSFDGLRIVGTATDPTQALDYLLSEPVDVLFLDIQMPGMNGFELLARLPEQPFVIFTTAYDEYALRAFQVNSIDYLLKPIEEEPLARAMKKLDRLRPLAKSEWQQSAQLPALLKELAAQLRGQRPEYPHRIASRVGERITFLDLDAVTHFVAQDKLTYAVVNGHLHCVDQTIAELEQRLDPGRFLRIHRSALVNVDWIQEVNSWFAGKVALTLKDAQRTQLTVARDRVRILKSRLGL